jgi:MerR family transcriptional regulator/heat shock protein HspR
MAAYSEGAGISNTVGEPVLNPSSVDTAARRRPGAGSKGLGANRRRGRKPVRRRHYTISVAAELVSVHQQTIRHYERLGLIEPYRGKGDIRYFSPEDIDRLLQIRRLVEELGVNLAGVEVILNMRDQMADAQERFEQELSELRDQYETENARLREIIKRLQER